MNGVSKMGTMDAEFQLDGLFFYLRFTFQCFIGYCLCKSEHEIYTIDGYFKDDKKLTQDLGNLLPLDSWDGLLAVEN